MGARLAKVSCFACIKREKRNSDHAENGRQNGNETHTANRTSEEIIEELRIIKVENTTETKAGVAFDVVESNNDEVPARPRRLPSLKRKNKVHPTGWCLRGWLIPQSKEFIIAKILLFSYRGTRYRSFFFIF